MLVLVMSLTMISSSLRLEREDEAEIPNVRSKMESPDEDADEVYECVDISLPFRLGASEP